MIEAFQIVMGVIGMVVIFGYSISRTIDIDIENELRSQDRNTVFALVIVQFCIAILFVLWFIVLGVS